ncbi:RNase H domain-containing protein [Trichonephila clavipes]|nr:RNase H domain-containing protein [Trichonephila clavipes]
MRLALDINEVLPPIVAREKPCAIQWVPAHVNIKGNELADFLANGTRNIDPPLIKTTSINVNFVAKHRFYGLRKKWCLPELNLDRIVTNIISRMRTGHMRRMEIMSDGSRTYTECSHCPGVQLDPRHLFKCMSVASNLFNIDPTCCRGTLYTNKVVTWPELSFMPFDSTLVKNQISELLGTEDVVQEYLDDMEDAENYRDRYIEICTRVDLKIRETVVPTETEKEALNYRKSN